MSRRVGLVAIGVDDVGKSLPVLKGAASGAKRIVEWLESQKVFGVECTCHLLIDGNGKKVTTHDVLDATRDLVEVGGLELLILYFSSHGIVQSANSELVLLSGADDYPNEAIDIATTLHNSRYLNIPHVLIISDACRNSVDAYSDLGRLSGVAAVKPFSVLGRRPGKVDIFYATEPSQTAKEYKGDGFFTQVLLETLAQPPDEVCEHWTDYPVPVIPTWLLENYLFEEVPLRAASTAASFDQTPDFTVTARFPMFLGFAEPVQILTDIDDTHQQDDRQFDDIDGESSVWLDEYVSASNGGEASGGFIPHVEKPSDPPLVFGGRSGRSALKEAAFNFLQTEQGNVSRSLLERAGLWDAYHLVKKVQDRDDGGRASALCVYGCSTVQVIVSPYGSSQTLRGSPVSIQTHDYPRSAFKRKAFALILDRKTITVLPAFEGYVGKVYVQDGLVQHVSFTPDIELQRALGLTPRDMESLRDAQAVAAAFARTGKLAALVDEDALTFARYLRRSKRADPTLGVYAAYAYALAGHQEGVDSVYAHFQSYRDYSSGRARALSIPFDVALLAGKLGEYPRREKGVAPFVPMMNLGWSMMANAPSYDRLYTLHSLRDLRLNAEWTTFSLESERILTTFFNL